MDEDFCSNCNRLFDVQDLTHVEEEGDLCPDCYGDYEEQVGDFAPDYPV